MLVVPLEALTRAVLPDSADVIPTVTEAEIRALTEIGHEVGEIDPHERRIIQQAFTLDTTQGVGSDDAESRDLRVARRPAPVGHCVRAADRSVQPDPGVRRLAG